MQVCLTLTSEMVKDKGQDKTTLCHDKIHDCCKSFNQCRCQLSEPLFRLSCISSHQNNKARKLLSAAGLCLGSLECPNHQCTGGCNDTRIEDPMCQLLSQAGIWSLLLCALLKPQNHKKNSRHQLEPSCWQTVAFLLLSS